MSSDSPTSSSGSELERLQAEGIRVFRTERPEAPPAMFFIKPIVDWFEMRLIEIMREDQIMRASERNILSCFCKSVK